MIHGDWLARCDRIGTTLSYALNENSHHLSRERYYNGRITKGHLEVCELCRFRMRFVEATFTRLNHRWLPYPPLTELIEICTRFEADCVVDDIPNRRFVVKQEYCFCGNRAGTIPLPLRETLEQRANSECLACGAHWRVAHCREGCGAPLDDRFDELCDKCKWIKCPAGHCSNADCDD